MEYPSIKFAVELAFVCGLTNMDEAIRNWDRSLMHGSYAEIPAREAKMSEELTEAMEVVENDTQAFWGMSLATANEVFKLGIDFEEETRLMKEQLWDF